MNKFKKGDRVKIINLLYLEYFCNTLKEIEYLTKNIFSVDKVHSQGVHLCIDPKKTDVRYFFFKEIKKINTLNDKIKVLKKLLD